VCGFCLDFAFRCGLRSEGNIVTDVLWVVIPAWNEAENLVELVPRVASVLGAIDPGGRLLVVDDGSTDETRKVMAALVAEDPSIDVVHRTRNAGKADALRAGFCHALERGADRIVMMDADGQDDPEELPKLLDRLEAGADLVTGARLERQDRFVKRNTSRVYNRATRLLSGAPGRDFNSGYKAMRAEVAADALPMLYGELHRYLTVISHWLGYRVAEVSVRHHPRMHGKSKYGLSRFWRGFVDLLTVRFLMSYEHRPSHLFSGFGAASFALGSLGMAYLFVLKIGGESIGGRPLLIASMLLIVVGLQLVLFGLLAELLVYTRQRHQRTPR